MLKKRITWVLFFGILAGILLAINLADYLRPPRDKYGAIEFENHPWMASFMIEYKMAVDQKADWVKDAQTVALRVAGYPNDDKIPPSKVDVETTEAGVVIFTILSRPLMDDSIGRQETRVELIKDGDIWKIVWAGLRQQCSRDSLGFGWTTSPCS